MKAVLERIELRWWDLHITVLDEWGWIRQALPKIKRIWDAREEAEPYVVLSLLGFPAGVLLGILSTYLK